MAKNLLDLADSMEATIAAIDNAASKTAVKAAIAIVGNLTDVTPVDTSNALSNWVANPAYPLTWEIAPHFRGMYGSTQASSAAAAMADAEVNLARKKPGEPIYINNNADYIGDLNAGSSKQEPAGFVERAIVIGRNELKNFKLEYKNV